MLIGPGFAQFLLVMKENTHSPALNSATDALNDVACPFCALVCDDLSLPIHNGQVQTGQLGCARARSSFERALSSGQTLPRLNGQIATWDDAIAQAGDLLHKAQRPLFHGLLGDLQDARAAWQLAAHFGGVVDHQAGDAIARNLRVFQDTGWQVTSLGEIRNRADRVIFIGDIDIPRLEEKLLLAEHRLHRDTPVQSAHLRTDALQILEQVRLLQRGGPLSDPLPQAVTLQQQLDASTYPVFVLGHLVGSDAELILRAAVHLVRDINEKHRAALTLLGTGLGDVTAQMSGAWHNGFGIRTDFSRGYPVQDLHAHAAHRLLESGEADLSVWLNTLGDHQAPDGETTQIVLGHPAMDFARPPAVYLPISVPGVHRAGLLHRADGLRMVPLQSLQPTELPTSQELAQRILAASSNRSEPC